MIPLRDENPSRTFPFVTYALIALNVAVWLWELSLLGAGVPVVAGFGLVPGRFASDPVGEAFTIFTSMFLHGGWQHLIGNMLFLYIFGDNVEDAIGHGRFGFFYLLSGVAAAAAQILVDPTSPVPMVGASGAIAGVLGAYLVLYPKAPVLVLNPVLPLWLLIGPFIVFPAWIVVGEWFAWNLWLGLASIDRVGGGVAFFAHLGGFVLGLLAVRPLMFRRERRKSTRWDGWRAPPRARRVPPRDDAGPRRDPWLS